MRALLFSILILAGCDNSDNNQNKALLGQDRSGNQKCPSSHMLYMFLSDHPLCIPYIEPNHNEKYP